MLATLATDIKVFPMPTERDRALDNERLLGEIWANTKQAQRDRIEIIARLDEQARTHNEMRGEVSDLGAAFVRFEERVKEVDAFEVRLSLLEERHGRMTNDFQHLSSFANLIRAYTVRILLMALLAIIAGMAAGLTASGNAIGWMVDRIFK